MAAQVQTKNGLNRATKWIAIVAFAIGICSMLTGAGMSWQASLEAQQQATVNADNIEENLTEIHGLKETIRAMDAKLDAMLTGQTDIKQDIRELRNDR